MTERKKVEKQIYFNHKSEPFTWKDIKDIQFEDDDIIDISYEEPYYSENNSWDGHYRATVIRMVDETDEQYAKRLERIKISKENGRRQRYETYLNLKKEFENE